MRYIGTGNTFIPALIGQSIGCKTREEAMKFFAGDWSVMKPYVGPDMSLKDCVTYWNNRASEEHSLREAAEQEVKSLKKQLMVATCGAGVEIITKVMNWVIGCNSVVGFNDPCPVCCYKQPPPDVVAELKALVENSSTISVNCPMCGEGHGDIHHWSL